MVATAKIGCAHRVTHSSRRQTLDNLLLDAAARQEGSQDGMHPVPVLLVDDDVELCSALKRLLAIDGFNLTAVHDAPSGVEQALHNEYALIILDVMLPGGDGRNVLRRIRVTSQVPVIMTHSAGR